MYNYLRVYKRTIYVVQYFFLFFFRNSKISPKRDTFNTLTVMCATGATQR